MRTLGLKPTKRFTLLAGCTFAVIAFVFFLFLQQHRLLFRFNQPSLPITIISHIPKVQIALEANDTFISYLPKQNKSPKVKIDIFDKNDPQESVYPFNFTVTEKRSYQLYYEFQPDQIIVKIKPDISLLKENDLSAIMQDVILTVVRMQSEQNLSSGSTMDDALRRSYIDTSNSIATMPNYQVQPIIKILYE